MTLTKNNPPQFNSSEISPDPPLIGESVSYGAEVFDSDGSVSYTNLSLSYGGSTVVSDEQRTGTTSPVWNDVFTPQDANKWLNATLEVVDDAGAVTEKEINRYLSDEAPQIQINSPSNSTFYGYNRTLDFQASDSDSKPSETFSCEIYNDGDLQETVSVDEGGSYQNSYLNDVGSRSFNVSCTDPAGNTNSSSVDFTVDYFNLSSVSGSSQVYETEQGVYNYQLKAGSMVENFTASLEWDNSSRVSEELNNSAVTDYSEDLTWRIPLEKNNATDYNWSIEIDAEYSNFNASGTSNEVRESSQQTQTVLQAYHSPNITVGRDRLIEKEDFDSDLVFENELPTEVADVQAYQRFNGTETNARYTEFEYPLVSSGVNSSTKTVSGDINVSFRGRSQVRPTVSNDSLTGHKKILTDCSSGSASQEVFHKYVVYNEENRSQKVDANIDYNFDVTHHGEHERNYAFGRSGKELETCIYPSWAEYQITGPVQYDATDFTARAYNFYNTTINNATDRQNFYLLPDSDSTAVYYRVEEADGSPVPGAKVKTLRYFVDKNSYLTISKVETDSNGESQTYQRINDIYYKYVITKDGEVLKETDREILTCQSTPCEKVFTVDEDSVSQYFKTQEAWSYNCQLNENDPSLQCTVNHDSDSMEKATLKVEEGYTIGDDQLCDISVTQVGSSMVCQLNNLSKYSYTYQLTGEKDGQEIHLKTGSIDQTDGIYGNSDNGLFMALFLVMIAAGLGTYSPGAGILWTGIGLTTVYMVGMLSIPITALTGILAVAVIAAIEVSS